jgi:hypothetical protein
MLSQSDLFVFVAPTSGGTWVVGNHTRFLTDFPCHAGGVTYGVRKTYEYTLRRFAEDGQSG